MEWLLTLFLVLDDGTVKPVPTGLMVNEASCRLAGATMAQAITAVRPNFPVGWKCEREVPSS